MGLLKQPVDAKSSPKPKLNGNVSALQVPTVLFILFAVQKRNNFEKSPQAVSSKVNELKVWASFYAFHSAVLLVESIVSRITVPWGKRAEEWQVLV